MKVAIVDYGAGNLPSVERALRAAGAETNLAARGAELADADSIVLPGVGHFDAIVAGLQKDSLGAALESAHQSGVPILGICLGLQVMFSISDESPQARGLGFLPGAVRALPPHVKSPHIGWNQVRRLRESVLLCGVPEDAYFYFAHSYAAPGDCEARAAVCDHGAEFAAVIERGNLLAVQFHPEKSGEAGAQVLRNFLGVSR
ncbi:MAG TPA: imidazole glycerol phosphate synthase subunit HisH [Candidatus Acidoferrales bacterium]|nr:imidazole glycerol phosphate synthase subunit HisH [Candidatus Acidoferrales bacterium]